MKHREPVYVTRPVLPELDEFVPYLRDIWESRVLTNNGKFHQELEHRLCEFLDIEHISLFSNGTLALVVALQALRITGEVITTPFSFVATTHALHWNGIRPVFCDIEPGTYNLDPARIEALITPQTTALLPVHVYGRPCNVVEIQKIADRYGLKVIYDAAHAFGVETGRGSLFRQGDLSVLSFHATKVFNTFEGGAIVCRDATMKQRIDFLKNFGFADEVTVVAPGINAKMNEFQAALGLLQLKRIGDSIEKRQIISTRYDNELKGVEGIRLPEPFEPAMRYNYAYYPVFIQADRYGMSRDEVYERFKSFGIFTRRYFYPLISQFPTYRGLPSAAPQGLPVARRVADEVLCLPIYPDLPHEVVQFIGEKLRTRFS